MTAPRSTMVNVGDKISTWFSDRADGLSTVLAVELYRGRYPQWFTHVARVTAPRTQRGWMEICLGPGASHRWG